MAQLETPRFDQREYGQILLDNRIVATLISDKTLTRSSCALAVDVGACDDPVEYPGLAHFTEHMLFLGTQKYPKENHYKDFLNSHGGSSNASTSMEATVYRFDVASLYFSEALDIFSQFFKHPLFSEESTSREIRAVDAEDSKNRQLDSRRNLQILKCLFDASHPYRKFSTGNILTLAKGDPEGYSARVREEMRSFYHHFYRSRKMGVALAGPQSIAELETLATIYFTDIPHNPLYVNAVMTLPQSLMETGQTISVNPVRELNETNLLWVLPSSRNIYRSDPCRLLSFLLGHEGEGSLFARLQTLGWATALSSGIRTSFQDFSLFQISISLTEDGFNHRAEIPGIVYEYVKLMRNMTDSQIHLYWDEMRVCDEVSFRFQMKGSTREKVATIAEHTLRCAPEHVLSYYKIFDPSIDCMVFRSFIERLSAGSEVILTCSKKFDWISNEDVPLSQGSSIHCDADASYGAKANRREPWYGVHFHQEMTPVSTCTVDQPGKLFLPAPNFYIPRYLLAENYCNRVPLTSNPYKDGNIYFNPPTCLYNAAGGAGKCWWSEDLLFLQPRSAIYVLFEGQFDWSEDFLESEMNALAERLFNQLTASKSYPSLIAGLHQSLSWSHKGLAICCNGYTKSLSQLLGEVVLQINHYLPSGHEVLFANVKEKYLQSLRSWTKNRPDQICLSLMTFFLESHRSLPTQKIEYVQAITPISLEEHLHKFLRPPMSLVCYCHGDINQTDAMEIFHSLPQHHSSPDDGAPTQFRKALLLNCGEDISFLFQSFNPSDANSAFTCHIQAGSFLRNPRSDAIRLVLVQFLKEPLYTELRTRQQLGYVVSLSDDSYGRGLFRRGGFTIRILSKEYHPLLLKQSVEKFFLDQRKVFQDLTQEDVSKTIESVRSILNDPPSSYVSESSVNWNRILENLPFDYSVQVLKELSSLGVSEIIASADEWMFQRSTRRAMIVMVCSNRHHSNMMTFRRGSVSTDDPVSFNCCDDAALGEGARYNKIEDLAGAKCLLSEERDEDLNQWCS